MSKSPTLPKYCEDTLRDQMRPDLFKALCDPIRISIVATLASRGGASTVTDIATCCGIDFSGVSRHLKILKDAGVLVAEREGRSVRYRMNAAILSATLRGIADALDACQLPAA
jgi:DNA-binding transcriptional ArsR family regulator